MISLDLARRLRDGGLRWTPGPGDRFVVVDRDMDDEVFVLSDMTVEVHQVPHGEVIGFNGTTEWALDSIEQQQSVWLPSETQLRELLGAAFRRLDRSDDRWRVTTEVNGRTLLIEHADPAQAYGLALLHLITGEGVAA
ncbi:MAG: pilus assembly protein CpaE [Actinomycetota bacterium]